MAQGLSSAEANRRLAALPERRAARSSRTYRDIIWANTVTVFNLILGSLFVLIVSLGSWQDGLFGGVIVANTAIGIIQEVRAKRTLDRLALLVAPTGRVWRDGALRPLPPDAIVAGDVIHLTPGDQAVADGEVVHSRSLSIDESILTGESEPVAKDVGDPVRSGSYCVVGAGDYLVTAAGVDSFAERLAAEAQGARTQLSPLQHDINRILRATIVLMVPLAIALVVARLLHRDSFFDGARTVVAALVPLVPEGLVLLTSLTFAVAAVRLGRLGVLAQRLNAIESLASVDVVCIDKTGTLTENRLRVERIEPATGWSVDAVRERLGIVAGSTGDLNATLRTIAESVTPSSREVVVEVPFSSERKWSGLTTRDDGTFVLGAPDILAGHGISIDEDLRRRIAAAIDRRHRVVLLAHGDTPLDPAGAVPPLTAVGAVVLSESIRPDAIDTVRFLNRQGTLITVISGDNPDTVHAVARDCGIDVGGPPVDGATLPTDDPVALEQIVERTRVFGRVTPHQKQELVAALTRRGRYVAMIGDGVNDVLALKEARLAIAIGAGSQMAKGISDMVLLRSDFAAMPRAIEEGRRILRNTHRVAKLFVTKTVYAASLLITLGLMPLAFPFLPRHLSVTSSLTIGIPAFFLALAPSAGPVRSDRFLRSLLTFTVPIGVVTATAIAVAYLVVRLPLDGSITDGRTAAVIVATALGLAIVVILEYESGAPGVRGWVWVMIVGFAVAFAVGLTLGSVRRFFEVSVPDAAQWRTIALVCSAAIGVMVAVRRAPWGRDDDLSGERLPAAAAATTEQVPGGSPSAGSSAETPTAEEAREAANASR